jgi:hypothetical protein
MFPVAKQQNILLIDHMELLGRYDRRKTFFIGDTTQRQGKNAGEKW